MKHLNTYITEYIVKKKLEKPIDSEDHYKYFPKTKEELISNIKELFDKGETNLNIIDTSKITDMSHLFGDIVNNINKINFDVSRWDVSKVENMYSMFFDCKKFKGVGLENWNVSNVTKAMSLFAYCENFDCDLSNWNVSKIENMSGMFFYCTKFKGIGLEKWNVKRVKDMNFMFDECTSIKKLPTWYKK